MNDLPTVTDAQIVAAQLRNEATRLIRLAEQLEATAPAMPRRGKKTKAQCPVELVDQIIKQQGAGSPARRRT